MKVILSRKGFDLGWGGKPSPILPDSRLVSLPIPDVDGIPYTDLRLDERSSYGEMMAELGLGAVRYPGRGAIPLPDARAHLDPDLSAPVVQRLAGWRPLFGQVDKAQGHLRRQGIGAGDVFLFYGWFRPVQRTPAGVRYVKGLRAIQALWGYLEVGEVLSVADTPVPPVWAADHPHFALRGQPRFSNANTVYMAATRLSGDQRRPGGGTLGPFTDALRLTKQGSSPSVWDLPMALHPSRTAAPLTYNTLPSSWSTDGDRTILRAARIGQEFVVEANEGIERWVQEVVESATPVRPLL